MSFKIKAFKDDVLQEAATRYAQHKETINITQKLIVEGQGIQSETPERLNLFAEREKRLLDEEEKINKNWANSFSSSKIELGAERKIGRTDDILSIEFLEAGLLAAKSVGRLSGLDMGTGFLVGHNILLTNHHVIESSEDAFGYDFELNAEEDKYGLPKKLFTCSLNPDRFFLTDKTLDFTFVAVDDPIGENLPLDNFGWHVLIKAQGKIRIGDPVNIIQHPDGGEKSIVLHNSNFLLLKDDIPDKQFCWYSGDTETGSSGAPVFNNRWEVVAVHHKAIPRTDENDNILTKNGETISEAEARANPEKIDWEANEGIRISKIVEHLEQAHFKQQDMSTIRDELIKLWNKRSAGRAGLQAAANPLSGHIYV